jgi:hypothetical protein
MISPQRVYETLCGLLIESAAEPHVENAFSPGKKCAILSDELYDARQQLCSRFHIPPEDRDLERVVNCFLEIEQELCIQMFRYGQLLSETDDTVRKA